MGKYKQGLYKPKNPQKYIGDVNNIVYRSSWETRFMLYLDYQPEVVRWASEELAIPYYFEFDQKWHRYFPDFYFEKNNADGTISKYMIEIKPKCDTFIKQPKKITEKTKASMLKNAVVVSKNEAKWIAAREFCNSRDIKFVVMTEDDLFKNK